MTAGPDKSRLAKAAPLFSIQLELTAKNLDPRYQHLNHDRALPLLEKARLEFPTQIGFSQSYCMSINLFSVVTTISIRYRREIGAGIITATCDRHELRGREFVMVQSLINSENKICVSADVGWLFMDGKTRRAAQPPEGFLQAASLIAAS